MRLILTVLLLSLIGCGDKFKVTRLEDDEAKLAKLEQNYSELLASINSMGSSMAAMQTISNNQQIAIAELQTRTTVTKLIDPCGDGPGYDEVFMRLSTGALVAYFESGTTHHLAALSPGTYRTTDSQACILTVTSDLLVCSNNVCE